MRQYIVRLLAEQYTVEAVPDGEAALAAIRRQTPDLILTDVMMPRLDGFGLLREVRGNPGTATVPVILLSARAGEESRVEGVEAGADDYLVKPFSARELLARVTVQVQMARLRREAGEALRQCEEHLRAVVETTPACIKVVAADGTLLSMNSAGLGMVDAQRPEDVQGGCIYDLTRRRILIVDDNQDSAMSLAMMLKLMGNEVRTAHDGLEGAAAAAAFRPNVILLDIGMPKLNGYDACRRIREQPWAKNTVIVALTGWGQEEDKRRSQQAGFNNHLVKPVEPAALEKLLADVKARTGDVDSDSPGEVGIGGVRHALNG
jgi:DNA-binding response OmpR family regulator